MMMEDVQSQQEDVEIQYGHNDEQTNTVKNIPRWVWWTRSDHPIFSPIVETVERVPLVPQNNDNNDSHTISQTKDEEDGNGSLASADSLSTIGIIEEDECMILSMADDEQFSLDGDVEDDDGVDKHQMDVAKYMSKREMTPLQEKMNALTAVPTFVYFIYFLLSGSWLSQELIAETKNGVYDTDFQGSCYSISWLPHLYAFPPLPVFAAAIGIILHAPFSFIYHWHYSHRLSPFDRSNHWSRRMDQSMIHVIAATMSYATSANLHFFLVNLFFNLDSIHKQFKSEVRPRRNQIRIGISLLAYTIPILRRGDFVLFTEILVIFAISAWLFGAYPIGGWSHSAFHFVIAISPVLLANAAIELPASQEQLEIAAKCAVYMEGMRS